MFLARVTQVTALFLCVSLSSATAQSCYDEYSKEEIAQKAQGFLGMKVTGLTLLGLGGASLVGGIVLMSNADWETYSTPTGTTTTTNDPQGGAGIVMLVVGVPLSVAGIVLSAIGSGKHREYKNCMEAYSLNVKVGKDGGGLAIVRAF